MECGMRTKETKIKNKNKLCPDGGVDAIAKEQKGHPSPAIFHYMHLQVKQN